MRADRPTTSAGDLGQSPGESELIEDLRGRSAHEDRAGLMPLGGLGAYEGTLAVDLGASFLGRPLRTSRDLLRRADPWGVRPDDAMRALGSDKLTAVNFLAGLVRRGLLSGPSPDGEAQDEYGHDYRTWKLTPTGKVLAYASGRRPSTRRAAEALVAKVLTSAASVNENPDERLWWVQEIRAVGHYADPGRAELLHVDLAVRLRPRLADRVEQAKAEQRLHDDAQDRGFTERVLDMNGYGHWKTRLALAGRSKAVRLFILSPGGEDGLLLFQELRDLTIAAASPPAYEPLAEPEPADRCSWCQRQVPATRVAVKGMSVGRSPIALCDACLALGRSEGGGFLGSLSVFGAVHDTLAALSAEPYHGYGCALCGNSGAVEGSWWPERDRRDQEEPVTLRLCDVCPGLLELADRSDRPQWWRARHELACLAGFSARLQQAAAVPLPRSEGRAKRRPLPRLTDVHRQLLEDVRGAGVLSARDLSRREGRSRQQGIKRWVVRLGHLMQHGLVVTVGTNGDEWTDPVRLVEADERELRRELLTLYSPGPVWDGTVVTEPEPPADWSSRWAALEGLRAERDHLAMTAAGATAGRS
ncbi:hypothetical protein [Kitasatospora sp. GP82]|uniref:hypothetical protein n=1 Tax=Kitasatospora sp. GP82 TaxID=3035089 RepID=UPI00247359C0|nr:hypothetical protein [Kitasatospora sp. GP82]MDH6128799.1 hypothetical protein [Kitasatospora sp. GP82]